MYAPGLKVILLILSNNFVLFAAERLFNKVIFSVISSDNSERLFTLNIFVRIVISSNFDFVIFKHFAVSLATVILALLGSSLISANSPK